MPIYFYNENCTKITYDSYIYDRYFLVADNTSNTSKKKQVRSLSLITRITNTAFPSYKRFQPTENSDFGLLTHNRMVVRQQTSCLHFLFGIIR